MIFGRGSAKRASEAGEGLSASKMVTVYSAGGSKSISGDQSGYSKVPPQAESKKAITGIAIKITIIFFKKCLRFYQGRIETTL